MTHPERDPIAEGLELARSMILNLADGNQADALFALNVADEATVKWAAGYMLSVIGEQAAILARHARGRRTAADLLRHAAPAIDQDIIATQVDDAIARLTGGERDA